MVYFKEERFPVGAHSKLSKRKFGPYRIIKRSGRNAFVLKPPIDMPTSPVFIVAKLYEFHGDPQIDTKANALPFQNTSESNQIEDIVDVCETATCRGVT